LLLDHQLFSQGRTAKVNAQSDSTCLAQARANRSGKWELDLTEDVCKDLPGLVCAMYFRNYRAGSNCY
jgi:hypothetical protein